MFIFNKDTFCVSFCVIFQGKIRYEIQLYSVLKDDVFVLTS